MFTEQRHIGNNIRLIRQLKGIKQEDFANKLGVKQQSISKMEKKKNMTEDQLKDVAKVLEVTSDMIKNFDEKVIINNNFLFNDQINNPVKEIIEYFKIELLKVQKEAEDIKIENAALKAELEVMKSGNSPEEGKIRKIK